MKTLKIEAPEGYEIDKEQSTFENIVFKEIKKELPKRWEELESILGYYVNENSKVKIFNNNLTAEFNQNVFVTEEQAKASIALAKLSQLREVYRNHWEPDWTNYSQDKYGIIFRSDGIEIRIFGHDSKFLSFQSKEIAEQFLNNFRYLIMQAKPLMS